MWSVATGEELLALNSVAFSADGHRLVSASHDATVKLWDARPWTDDLQAEQRASAFVAAAWRDVLTRDKVLKRIDSDQTISETVRKQARKLVETWPDFKSQ